MNRRVVQSPHISESGKYQIALHDDMTGIDREQWEALHISSLYLSYDWLLTTGTIVSQQPQLLTLWSMPEYRLRAGFPVHIITQASYAPYDPVRVMLDEQIASKTRAGLSSSDTERFERLATQVEKSRENLYPILTSATNAFTTDLSHAPDMDRAQAIAMTCEMLRGFEEIARTRGAGSLAFLYVPDVPDSILHEAALNTGYLTAVINAECSLPIRWKSFDDYLQSRVKTRRTSIRAEISRFESRGFSIQVCGVEALTDELASLHAMWRQKYGRPVSEEELKRQYAGIREHLGSIVRLFIACKEQRPVAFALFYEYNGVYYLRSIGFDYPKLTDEFCYFNLIFYAPIREAIRAGIKAIHYSMESYDAKLGRGCKLRHLLAYIRPLHDTRGDLAQFMQLLDRGQRAYFNHVMDRHPERLNDV